MSTQLALIADPAPPPYRRRRPFAVFSECTLHGSACRDRAGKGRLYRYLLGWPTRNRNRRVCLWVLANPSTATAETKDPTITTCLLRAERWGYGWSWTVNVRAWRETNPKLVPRDARAVGPDNDRWIHHAVRRADLVICGWGKLDAGRGQRVLGIIREAGKVPHALRVNMDGSPHHPLYLPADLQPIEVSR